MQQVAFAKGYQPTIFDPCNVFRSKDRKMMHNFKGHIT